MGQGFAKCCSNKKVGATLSEDSDSIVVSLQQEHESPSFEECSGQSDEDANDSMYVIFDEQKRRKRHLWALEHGVGEKLRQKQTLLNEDRSIRVESFLNLETTVTEKRKDTKKSSEKTKDQEKKVKPKRRSVNAERRDKYDAVYAFTNVQSGLTFGQF